MKGQQDSSSYTYEIGGVVLSTGSGVSRLSIGDPVICLNAGRFDSSFHVP
jgi:NADPH:quinone reductase-like Zn-dependent oxidoreductase